MEIDFNYNKELSKNQYDKNNNAPIIFMGTEDYEHNCDVLNVAEAKEVIKTLQNMVDYLEDKNQSTSTERLKEIAKQSILRFCEEWNKERCCFEYEAKEVNYCNKCRMKNFNITENELKELELYNIEMIEKD